MWLRMPCHHALKNHSQNTCIVAFLLHLLSWLPSRVNGNYYMRFLDDTGQHSIVTEDLINESLKIIYNISTGNFGTLCLSETYRTIKLPLNAQRYDASRQKVDLAAIILKEVGLSRHSGLLDALAKGLLSDSYVTSARILTTNFSNFGILSNAVWYKRNQLSSVPIRMEEDGVLIGSKPDYRYPWFEESLSTTEPKPSKFAPNPANNSYQGWWTYPYYSCVQKQWLISYSVGILPTGRHSVRGYLSIDVDVSNLEINQCDNESYPTKNHNNTSENKWTSATTSSNEFDLFYGSHKCHRMSMQCKYHSFGATASQWNRGAYQCVCRNGYYSTRHPTGFNGTIMENAYEEYQQNISMYYMNFVCEKCAPGCLFCTGPEPCVASYNWPFRLSLLTFSILCAACTGAISIYMFQHRKIKVFKVASPIFLTITLLGCAIMYLEMAAIFPILDMYSCVATKWTRHMGFCITYTALLMKTWRVSLTYRVKSAHKVKLTDKQLLQWMVPILLVMLIYLGTWTLSATPHAVEIKDSNGLIFKQCAYDWWDHSLALGEIFFLGWGIRVCYNVRNAESMYNEARQISFAIYNIALVNCLMIAFHLIIFPQAGPDIKYLLGFVRTQLSTSTTIALVFGPKIARVVRGQGDQWDKKSRFRGITASFSLNGVGLVEETTDVYQENEELKEEIQKLAGQIEFMRIVHMEMNNRHLKPKPGGYFTIQSPVGKSIGVQSNHHRRHHTTEKDSRHESSGITDDGQSGSHSGASNSIGNPVTPVTSSSVSNPGNMTQITSSIVQPGTQSPQQHVIFQQSSTNVCQLTTGIV